MAMWEGHPRFRAILDSLITPEFDEMTLQKKVLNNHYVLSLDLGRLASADELAGRLGVDPEYIDVVLPELRYTQSGQTWNPYIGYTDEPSRRVLRQLQENQRLVDDYVLGSEMTRNVRRLVRASDDLLAGTSDELRPLARAGLRPNHADWYEQTMRDVLLTDDEQHVDLDQERRALTAALLDDIWRSRLDLAESARPQSSVLGAGISGAIATSGIVGTIITLGMSNLSLGLIVGLVALIIISGLGAALWTRVSRRGLRRRSIR